MKTNFFLMVDYYAYSKLYFLPNSVTYAISHEITQSWRDDTERYYGIMFVGRCPNTEAIAIYFNTLENMTKFQMNYL